MNIGGIVVACKIGCKKALRVCGSVLRINSVRFLQSASPLKNRWNCPFREHGSFFGGQKVTEVSAAPKMEHFCAAADPERIPLKNSGAAGAAGDTHSTTAARSGRRRKDAADYEDDDDDDGGAGNDHDGGDGADDKDKDSGGNGASR